MPSASSPDGARCIWHKVDGTGFNFSTINLPSGTRSPGGSSRRGELAEWRGASGRDLADLPPPRRPRRRRRSRRFCLFSSALSLTHRFCLWCPNTVCYVELRCLALPRHVQHLQKHFYLFNIMIIFSPRVPCNNCPRHYRLPDATSVSASLTSRRRLRERAASSALTVDCNSRT